MTNLPQHDLPLRNPPRVVAGIRSLGRQPGSAPYRNEAGQTPSASRGLMRSSRSQSGAAESSGTYTREQSRNGSSAARKDGHGCCYVARVQSGEGLAADLGRLLERAATYLPSRYQARPLDSILPRQEEAGATAPPVSHPSRQGVLARRTRQCRVVLSSVRPCGGRYFFCAEFGLRRVATLSQGVAA